MFEVTDWHLKVAVCPSSRETAERELRPEATVKEYLTVQTEGCRQVERPVDHDNLDVIISVGCRVKSRRGTQFRIWATL